MLRYILFNLLNLEQIIYQFLYAHRERVFSNEFHFNDLSADYFPDQNVQLFISFCDRNQVIRWERFICNHMLCHLRVPKKQFEMLENIIIFSVSLENLAHLTTNNNIHLKCSMTWLLIASKMNWKCHFSPSEQKIHCIRIHINTFTCIPCLTWAQFENAIWTRVTIHNMSLKYSSSSFCSSFSYFILFVSPKMLFSSPFFLFPCRFIHWCNVEKVYTYVRIKDCNRIECDLIQ